MSIDNPSHQEKIVTAEINRLIERLSRKGFRCIVMVSATDGKGGATVGAGEWDDEIERAMLLRESMERLQDEYVGVMVSLSTLARETAGNA